MKTKTKRWNIMSVNVDISDYKFSKSKISINRGKHIRFKSTDGNSYTVSLYRSG
jgi:plastocyanin